jgi:transcriptional repressor NrdR
MIYIIKIQSVRQEDRGVKCPFCNEADTKVIDSRPADDNSSIRRRRQCEKCGKRFTTYEKLETMPLMVIKKDRSREVYDRSKIESGILHSCHKRPVSSQQIDFMVDEVETQVFNREEKEVESTVIGELVMKKLQEIDEVAYVRFASVYREFKDVNTFIEEIGKLLKK